MYLHEHFSTFHSRVSRLKIYIEWHGDFVRESVPTFDSVVVFSLRYRFYPGEYFVDRTTMEFLIVRCVSLSPRRLYSMARYTRIRSSYPMFV